MPPLHTYTRLPSVRFEATVRLIGLLKIIISIFSSSTGLGPSLLACAYLVDVMAGGLRLSATPRTEASPTISWKTFFFTSFFRRQSKKFFFCDAQESSIAEIVSITILKKVIYAYIGIFVSKKFQGELFFTPFNR